MAPILPLLALTLACTPKADPGGDTACVATTWSLDLDGDGYAGTTTVDACVAPAHASGAVGDCDDGAAAVHPGAEELCDGVDNDCDGVLDPDPTAWYADADGDGFGAGMTSSLDCAQPDGWVADATDCDDGDAAAYPGAAEIWYDGVDQDCAGDSDFDADGDGADSLDLAKGTDCDDTDASVGPAMAEICFDGVDNDCSGEDGACGLGAALTFDDADAVVDGDEPFTYLGTTVALLRGATVTGDVLAVSQLDYYGELDGDRVDLYSFQDGELEPSASVSGAHLYAGLGDVIHSAQDYTGDGVADLAITASEAVSYDWGGPGRAYLYTLPVSGDLSVVDADTVIEGVTDYSWATFGLVPIEGWGMDAPVIGASASRTDGDGLAYFAGTVYLSLVDTAVVQLRDSFGQISCNHYNCRFGEDLLATDLDGDGVDDVLATVAQASLDAHSPSSLLTFLGPVKGSYTESDYDGGLLSDEYDRVGWELVNLGDQDGDGVDDLMVPGGGRDVIEDNEHVIWLYSAADLAGASATGDLARAAIVGSRPGDNVGEQLSAGDLNGDGFMDVVSAFYGLTATSRTGSELDYAGQAFVWYGPLSGTRTIDDADVVISGSDEDVALGWDITASGDLNGDGCDDLATTEVRWPSSDVAYGRVGLFLGGCE